MQSTFHFRLKFLCIAVLLCQSGFAYSEIHGTITGTTDYVWRMYSKSNNEPAIQANLDYQHSTGLYFGISVSSFGIGPSELEFPGIPFVFNDPAQVEMTPYVGWSYKIDDDWQLNTQYSRYFYDGKVYGQSADYNEFYLFLHYKDLLTVQASYTNDFYGLDGDAFFTELTGRYPLTDFLQITSSFGYARTNEILIDDYKYWNVGLIGTYKFISLDLRYYDAVEVELGEDFATPIDHPITLDPTVVFSLSAGF